VEIRGKSPDRRAKADLVRFFLFGESAADPTLLDGDTIYVPLRDYEVEASGAVKRPGRYELVGDRTVKELIELAGGVSTDGAVGIPLRLTTRGPGDQMAVRSLSTLSEAMDAQLRPGDRVHFPSLADLQRTITVEGAIRLGNALPDPEHRESSTGQPLEALATPRAISVRLPYVEGDGVRDVVVKAGGLQAWADPSAAYLLRTGSDGALKRIPVDVVTISAGQKPDTAIEPRDTLVIPSRREAVVVGGAVYHPGVYAYSRGLKPLDYVTLAGGATRTARPGSARIVRRSGQSADLADVQEIEPGDVISVPESQIGTAEWINFALIFVNIAVTGAVLVYTVTHR
jgi:protein involved in polysaccharide export with SLBB domain